MAVVSIIGHKGGVGKTTLSINIAAAITQALNSATSDKPVCLFDLDLRLPTITGILNSHPQKTFFDLFETLANRTYQVDFLQTLYQILVPFREYKEGNLPKESPRLLKSIAIYKNLNEKLFNYSNFEFGDQIHELFLMRGEIERPSDLRKKEVTQLFKRIDIKKFKNILREYESNAQPNIDEYISYIEEYGFAILGGEIPIIGKKHHRQRINEPEFLALFLEFIQKVCEEFGHVILDTPAGGVNHLSSIMNSIDQVLFIFDVSNTIAIKGSIDALHTFIDYYEDFYENYQKGSLSGLDKAYVDRLILAKGEKGVLDALANKKMGIIFNRCQTNKEIPLCLDQLREYLETLDKYEKYKDRIHLVGLVPNHKVINITNNRGTLFYDKDKTLSNRVDAIARSIIDSNVAQPTLAYSNKEILSNLEKRSKSRIGRTFSRIASSLS
ncbi:MAG: AAA family ATPase [Nitrospina sp.]|nr:AAA family ATPase [Nitrospina sp.]